MAPKDHLAVRPAYAPPRQPQTAPAKIPSISVMAPALPKRSHPHTFALIGPLIAPTSAPIPEPVAARAILWPPLGRSEFVRDWSSCREGSSMAMLGEE